MKLYAIAATVGLLTNIGAINVSPTDTNLEFQIISVPHYELDFSRGEYSIIKQEYDKKTILSDSQLIEILKLAGFEGKELKMAWAIAIKESTARPYALNKSSNCYGLFQINMSGSMGPDRREKYGLESNEELFNPLTNAQIAYKMSNGGKNWTAWSTEKSAKLKAKEFPST